MAQATPARSASALPSAANRLTRLERDVVIESSAFQPRTRGRALHECVEPLSSDHSPYLVNERPREPGPDQARLAVPGVTSLPVPPGPRSEIESFGKIGLRLGAAFLAHIHSYRNTFLN